MARGWESKAVESQMEEAAERRRTHVPPRRAEDIAIERERDNLLLDRTRVTHDIAAATNPRYREMLERALKFLDEKLAKLDAANKPGLRG